MTFFFFLGPILFILDLSGNAEITEFLTGAQQVALWYSRFPAFHSFSIWSEVHQGHLKQILQPSCLWRAHHSPAVYRWLRGLPFPVFTCPQHSRLLCRKHCHKPRELAAFQALKFTPQAVSFMEIDSLIYVWEVLGTLCGM